MSLVYDILALRSNSEGIYLELGLRLQAQINLTFLPFTNPSFVSSLLSCFNHGHIQCYAQRNKTSGFLAPLSLLTSCFLTKGSPRLIGEPELLISGFASNSDCILNKELGASSSRSYLLSTYYVMVLSIDEN